MKLVEMFIDAHNHIGIETANYLNSQYPYAQSLEDMKAKASGTRVSHWLVFPFVSYPTDSTLGQSTRPHTELKHPETPYGLANENLLSEISNFDQSEQKHFLPVAIIDPSRRVAEQIPHLRRLHASSRFYALKIQGTIIQSKVSDLLDTGSAFLDLAAEWNVPFLIHSSILPNDIWSQASDILRVVESRPDVRFLLAHSCRFHKPSLDRIAELPNAWFDCSAHRIHCDLAERNQATVAVANERFPADYSKPAEVLRELAKAYPDKLIWGTDSPYYSWIENSHGKKLRLVSSYADEWACVEALPESMIKAITQTNTLNWLGINADRI